MAMATEIVPQIPMDAVQKANSDLGTLKLELGVLADEADALVVNSPQTYGEAGELLRVVRDRKKSWLWSIAPLKAIAKTIGDRFRTMELDGTNYCLKIESVLEQKLVQQKRLEREAAAAEERRINKEAHEKAEKEAARQLEARMRQIEASRKAGKVGKREAGELKKEAEAEAEAATENVQTVTVMDNTPKIAGLRQRVNYYAECHDTSKLLDAYVKADPQSRAFLARFLEANEKEIGAYARETKSDEVVMTRIPGTKAWHEDTI